MTIRLRHWTAALAVALASQVASADLIIEEIVDATNHAAGVNPFY